MCANFVAKTIPFKTALMLAGALFFLECVHASPLSLGATSLSSSYINVFDPTDLTLTQGDTHQSIYTGPANLALTIGSSTYTFDNINILIRDSFPFPSDEIRINSANATDNVTLQFVFPSTTFTNTLLSTGLDTLQNFPYQNAIIAQLRFNGVLTEALTSFSITAVPEPSSISIVLGLLGAWGFLSRRR